MLPKLRREYCEYIPLFQPKLKLAQKFPNIDPSSGPVRGRDEATDPMPFEYELPGALTQPGSL